MRKLNFPQNFNTKLIGSAGENIFVAASVVTAFVIRLIFLPRDAVVNPDGSYYTLLGERFMSGDFGGGISAYWSPLYSILTGIFITVFDDRELGGRFVSLLAGTLLVIPAYLLIRDLYGNYQAYIGTFLMVLHPLLIKSSGVVMVESLYTFIFLTFVLFGWYALKSGKLATFFITGLILGASYLTKPEAIGFLFLMLLLLICLAIFGSVLNIRQLLASYLMILFGFALLFVPYVVFIQSKTGEWTISKKTAVNSPAFHFEGELGHLSPDGRSTMKDIIWGDDYRTSSNVPPQSVPAIAKPPEYSQPVLDMITLSERALSLIKFQLKTYFPELLPFPLILFAIIGFFDKPWSRERSANELYLFSIVACSVIGYALSVIETRYLFPLIPILIAWAANGIVEFSNWAIESAKPHFQTITKLKPQHLQAVTLMILVAVLSPRFVATVKANGIEDVPFEEKEAGVWIKNRSNGSRPLVLSSNITVAFYAEAKHLYIPDADIPAIINYAKMQKADYLVFNKRWEKDGPAFQNNEYSLISEFRLVYHDAQEPIYEIRVFQRVDD